MAGASMAAFGIGVADLERATDFYTRVLGMTEMQRFDLEDMDEVIVGFEGSAVVALMRFKADPPPNCANLPVKLVFSVPDPKALMARIRAEGLEVTREPAPFPGLGPMLVGLAKDPDGYVVELLGPPSG
jgi:lactoylglutathione lyase